MPNSDLVLGLTFFAAYYWLLYFTIKKQELNISNYV